MITLITASKVSSIIKSKCIRSKNRKRISFLTRRLISQVDLDQLEILIQQIEENNYFHAPRMLQFIRKLKKIICECKCTTLSKEQILGKYLTNVKTKFWYSDLFSLINWVNNRWCTICNQPQTKLWSTDERFMFSWRTCNKMCVEQLLKHEKPYAICDNFDNCKSKICYYHQKQGGEKGWERCMNSWCLNEQIHEQRCIYEKCLLFDEDFM